MYLASFTASLKVYPVVVVIPYTLQCHITGITKTMLIASQGIDEEWLLNVHTR
jgi:hypothetical protein